jgi:hypothetical protein
VVGRRERELERGGGQEEAEARVGGRGHLVGLGETRRASERLLIGAPRSPNETSNARPRTSQRLRACQTSQAHCRLRADWRPGARRRHVGRVRSARMNREAPIAATPTFAHTRLPNPPPPLLRASSFQPFQPTPHTPLWLPPPC